VGSRIVSGSARRDWRRRRVKNAKNGLPQQLFIGIASAAITGYIRVGAQGEAGLRRVSISTRPEALNESFVTTVEADRIFLRFLLL